MNAKIIFDNAGGVTLILNNGEFAHSYSDATKAAQDYCIYMRDGDVDCWEGHEPELAEYEPSFEDIRNGGCKVYEPSDVEEAIHTGEDFGWNNIREFVDSVEKNTGKI